MRLHDYTKAWWERVLDEGRLDAWLKRLHQAETQGAERFQDLIERWKPEGEALDILFDITLDEVVHGGLVSINLDMREVEVPAGYPSGPERYWDAVYAGVVDLETACAAAAFGEVLALNRFRVLIAHPRTPEDVRALAECILPDEERHARELRRLAGKRGMDRIRPCHRAGMAALGLGHVEDDD